MKTKVFSFFTIINIYILVLSSCSTVVPATNAPISLTSTNTSFPTPTNAPTITPLPPTPTLVSETAFIKGITLNNFGSRLNTANAQEVIQHSIVPSGANYVILVPTCWSTNMHDTNIVCPHERIEGGIPPVSDEELIDAIQYLHSIGLRVVIKPQALVQTVIISNQETKERHWNEEQWKEWFDSYILFITHYAQIAEDQRVDLFVVGNEQEDNTKREENWRRIITSVREVYHGQITYAANAWSFEASRIKFWDALDYIGTNGYQFGFVSKKDPTVEDMVQAWQPYLQRLEEMSKEYDKQVIITEIGAVSKQNFNTGSAHDGTARPYDGQEQADYYTAFFEALEGKPWVKGILLWDVYTDPLQGGPNDISYTFIAKPAEQVVWHYFGGSVMILTPTPTADVVEDTIHSMIIYDDYLKSDWHVWTDPNATIIPDLYSSNGNQSGYSIQLPLSKYQGIGIDYVGPLNMIKYKWLEFYIMVGEHEPKNLLVQFENWTPDEVTHSRIAIVNDPNYIEGGQYRPGTWQRVRIPLIDLGIVDQDFTGFGINNCAWPCQLDPTVDNVYIDNIKLIAAR